MPPRLYSLGYQGDTVAGLVRRLTGSSVSLVVDVRLSPRSRKPGFSKQSLTAELARAGIDYRHEPDLGNPPENRDGLRRGDHQARARLRSLLVEGSGPALRRLADDAARRDVAVLCLEGDRRRCHRDVVTDLVREIDPDIAVVPLD